MSNDLFDDNSSPVIDPNKDYIAELVGEGKKFKDTAALARGKMESDFFVTKLQNEISELRQEVTSRAKLEDIVSRLSEQRQPEPPQAITPTEPPQSKGFNEEDLEALLNKKLTERETSARRESNVRDTQDKLREAFGSNYVDVLRERAEDLGVDPKWFNGLAAENPKALLKLVGAEGTPAKGNDLFSPPPQGHQTFKPGTTERDRAFYDKMKKENSVQYWSKENQVAMHKDAMRLGERFFV